MGAWLLYASAILLTRLCYLPNDRRLPIWLGLGQWAAQLLLVLLLFKLNLPVFGLLVYLTLVAVLIHLLETPSRILSGFRLLTLAAQLLLPLVLLWALNPAIEIRAGFAFSEQMLLTAFILLLLINEANYLIRLLFNWCNVIPKTAGMNGESKVLDEDEYKAGRVIGMLERTLILLLIYFTEDFSAVGFIVAAKGLIRLRQLKDRQFSEYILIGTLASVMCALVGALLLLNFD
ncbi:MAG: hypothetical protein WD071_06565 [Pseudohongiella sp.]|uniref:hypothetical protein n=1 Tax=Pseudohongiella sp. TaxID=1979412 RepID=UPI0034A089D5